MKKMFEHQLQYDRSFDYIKNNLENTSSLSTELLHLVSFESGSFFTILPIDANFEKLYDFDSGGILPQNIEKEFVSSKNLGTYSEIPTLQDELANYVIRKAKKNKKLSCVLDDIDRSPDNHSLGFFRSKKVSYSFNKEHYFVIKNDEFSYDLIIKCLEKSNAIWHSLCVLATINLTYISGQTLSAETIQHICQNAQTIIVGAYDSEGYVLWEKRC
jgi:hypothetical protein